VKPKEPAVLIVSGIIFWIADAFFDFPILTAPLGDALLKSGILLVLLLIGVRTFSYSQSQEATVRAVRNTLETYRSLMDHLPVGVYRATPDGRILEANRTCAEMLGYESVETLKQNNLSDLYVKKSDREEHLVMLRDSPVFAEFELRRKDSRTLWVRDYPKAILASEGNIAYIDGVLVETLGIDAVIRAITEHRRLETMKDQFISAVTHELRTPLVSIKGYVDYILAKETKSVPDSIKSSIEVVKRNADRLLDLTNDLIDIQRMESGRPKLNLENISFREILTQCVEEIQPLLKQKNQEIAVDVPAGAILVEGDHLRLSQVLMNLLNNASKFTSNGGHITIHVQEDRQSVTVHITDTGIGLEKKDLERVFEPFAAIEKPTYFKGTGLGLSLTKRLVEAHGGRIWASSAGKGQGATFAFALPKQRVRVLG